MKSMVTIGLVAGAITGTQMITQAAWSAFMYEKFRESGQHDAAVAVDEFVRARCYKHQIKLYDAFKNSLAALYFMG